MADIPILYEDDCLIAACKPRDVLSEASDTAPNMPSLLRAHTGGDIMVVHRLDKATQGLTVYAKTPAAAAALSAQIQRGELQKTYLAVVGGRPETDEGRYTDLLFFDRRRCKSYVVDRERRGVRRAELCYTVLGGDDEHTLVRVELLTGRTHQIRVQFSHRGMPIVGDRRYGGAAADYMRLCSHILQLTHPVTGERLMWSMIPDEDFFCGIKYPI